MAVDKPSYSKCEHVREFLNIVSPNPAEYHWKCMKCGKLGMDIVGKRIETEVNDREYFKTLKMYGSRIRAY